MSVTITPKGAASKSWSPVEGQRTSAFVAKKTGGTNGISASSIQTVIAEAKQILSYCIFPDDPGDPTAVLAVGYVQSGKTLSFTAVTSLARDNGYGIVILLAGTTNNLKGQSEDRLAKDLSLEDLQRDWRHFDNPDASGSTQTDIRQTVTNWDRKRKNLTVDDKPAVLITLLKHASRLNSAAQVLSNLSLTGIPTLIIDDESDQAGLNTSARKNLLNGTADESGTYEAIIALRDSLPHHSYLQYTATPQANLLLAVTDALDPAFAKVITNGDGYTGGKTFFRDRRSDLIVDVPISEVFDPAAPFTEPPLKLQEALQVFLLGIAAGAGANGPSNRSMMVQAHQNTQPHALYATWVRSLVDSWSSALRSEDPVTLTEIKVEFANAYSELASTVHSLPTLDELLALMAEKIAEVRIVIVNSTKDAEKQIKWNTWDYWILIGGQKLDRGFTVEGLTVTYMPRPTSANADVLQQRARFFGYRSKYIDFCRVYLTRGSSEAFAGYVEDEEFLRSSLKDHEGQPLKAWKRDFTLHTQLTRPTRANIVGRNVKRVPVKKGWIWPKSMHLDTKIVQNNKDTFASYRLKNAGKLVDATALDGVVDKRVDASRNELLQKAPLSEVLEFLIALRFYSQEDSLQLSALRLALGRQLAKDPQSEVDVIFMSRLKPADGPGRDLAVLRGNIHVGMSPNGAAGDQVLYSGDRSVVSGDKVTLQLRMVRLKSTGNGSTEVVPWIAFHFPAGAANDAWLEDA